MKKSIKVLLIILCSLLVTIFLVLLGHWLYKNRNGYDMVERHKTLQVERHKTLQVIETDPGVNSFKCDMTKLWGSAVEAEFLAEILFDYDYISSPIDNIRPSSVLAISVNNNSVKNVRRAVDIAQPRVLLLLSDEWEDKKEYEKLFSKVPLVYRQYRYDTYNNPPNQRILPLGYHCWDQHARRPSMPKKYIWSFIGNDKGDRERDLKVLNELKPNFHGKTKPEENPDILNSSVFVYCPVGNYNVETSRPYTASMCGAIPCLVCTQAQWDSTYPYFDIEPPWLHADSAEKIRDMMKSLLENPDELRRLQHAVSKWWVDMKRAVYKNINDVVTGTPPNDSSKRDPKDFFTRLLYRGSLSVLNSGLNQDFNMVEYVKGNMSLVGDKDSWRKVYMYIDRPELVKWNDKIWLAKWYWYNNIQGPPIIHFSNKSPNVSRFLQSRLRNRSVIVKPSHLSNSKYIYKVDPNDKITQLSAMEDRKELLISLQELDTLLLEAWNTKALDEDLPMQKVLPGVIVEDYIDSHVELGYFVIWGLTSTIRIIDTSLDSINLDTRIHLMCDPDTLLPQGDNLDKLPSWWHQGKELAEKIATIAGVDFVRIDLVEYNGVITIREFTWNPGVGSLHKMKEPWTSLLSQGYNFLKDKEILHHSHNEHGTLIVTEVNGKRCIKDSPKHHQGCMLVNEPDKVVTSPVQLQLSTLLFNVKPKHILMIGLGTGTLPKALKIVTPQSRVTSIEINSMYNSVVQKYFGYSPCALHETIIDDGASYIQDSFPESYDIIVLDAFDNTDCPPDVFSSEVFFRSVKNALTRNGIITINVLSGCNNGFISTFQSVFGEYHLISMGLNQILIGKKGTWPTYNEIKEASMYWSERLKKVGLDASQLALYYKDCPSSR